MAPRLRVLAGTSPTTMTPITPLVNTSRAHYVSSPLFEGRIVVHIKGMTDEKGRVRESEYFDLESRAGVTWSIQVQGRFLAPYSADDILFGNTFDRPLKLPWGTSAVLKFMHYIDPTLEHDLTSSSKPWALSPLISTMPHFTHTRRRAGTGKMASFFPTREAIGDDTRELYLALAADSEEVDHERGGDGEVEVEVEESGKARAAVVPAPAPVLVPGSVSPIPATSSRQSMGSSQVALRNGSVGGLGVTSHSSTTRRASGASSSSSASSASSSSSSAFMEQPHLHAHLHAHLQVPKAKRGHGHGQGSSSVSVSSSSSAASASASSSVSGSGSSSGVGSSSSSHGSHKSTRSSGLGSIRMKTKDVVRKVKGSSTSKKGVSGAGGGGGVRGDDEYEARRRRKEEEMRGLENAAQRRAYFASKERRKDVVLGPEDVITTDFCYGFITFAPSLALQLPGGLSFDLMKYWDGQPVRFVCCERPGAASGRGGSEMHPEEPWGRIFWCVAIEVVDDEA